ncbi:MAG: molybdenum cofactor biosynthesis protein [Peptococcaceae bacterium BRH_c8a]|nr:MAG: molybdenum cofactor biosynthesis protein [Peptococcaceae bacterium BRH_c8a]
MTELFQARTVREARELLAGHIKLDGTVEKVSLLDALGRRLAREVTAVDHVPGFDRSTMDGFAVRARDTFGASESLPAYLDVGGEVLMGCEPAGGIAVGQAWHIPTGGMLPPGADGVVMVEHTEELDDRTVGVNKPVAPGEHVVRAGEDIIAGAVVLPEGHLIRPQDLGLLSAVGVTEVPVTRRLRVGIISTGDEVVEPTQTPKPGQVRDINSYVLYGQALAAGARPEIRGIASDEFELLLDMLQRAVDECDLVLLSGGSSVGTRDVASQALDTLGTPGVLFHGISIKPGKPTVGAVVGGKPVFGLPGHPVSAAVVFELFVTPLIKYWGYVDDPLEFPVRARLMRNMRSAAGREDYIRVQLARNNGDITAEPVLGKSGLISTMVRADGLAHIPAEKEGVEAGEYINVKLF